MRLYDKIKWDIEIYPQRKKRRFDMSLLIKNGRVIDPACDRDGIFDVLVEEGIIKKV